MSDTRLLPCPFCGGDPFVIPDDSYGGCHIGCSCEHEPGIIFTKDKLDEAKTAWNRRWVK